MPPRGKKRKKKRNKYYRIILRCRIFSSVNGLCSQNSWLLFFSWNLHSVFFLFGSLNWSFILIILPPFPIFKCLLTLSLVLFSEPFFPCVFDLPLFLFSIHFYIYFFLACFSRLTFYSFSSPHFHDISFSFLFSCHLFSTVSYISSSLFFFESFCLFWFLVTSSLVLLLTKYLYFL